MRASKLVMCALSSTQALTRLDEALVRSVQCSKQARKALARGDVPVAWLDVTAADDAVAERLAPLLAWPARCAHQCSESSNRLKRAAAMAMVRCEFVVLSQWYEALRNVSNCCVGCAGRE